MRLDAAGELLLRLFAALLNAHLLVYTMSASLRAQAGGLPAGVRLAFSLQSTQTITSASRSSQTSAASGTQGRLRTRAPLRPEALLRPGVQGLLVALQALYTHARYVTHASRSRGVATSPGAAPSRAAC